MFFFVFKVVKIVKFSAIIGLSAARVNPGMRESRTPGLQSLHSVCKFLYFVDIYKSYHVVVVCVFCLETETK